MFKLKNLILFILITLTFLVIGCSKEESTASYTDKNQPHFILLADEFEKISKLGLSYDTSVKHLEEFLSISKNIRKKLPKAMENKNTTQANSSIKDLDDNYSLFLKDTEMLVSESSINKIIILKNYLEVTNKMDDLIQDLNGANNGKLMKIEEALKTSWMNAQKNIKQLNNQNKDVITALTFTNNIIKDLEENISALKVNKEPIKPLGSINNKAIEHISSLKENVKKNQITTITYLLGLIKTIDAKWSNLPVK